MKLAYRKPEYQPTFEFADIIRRYGSEYKKRHKLSLHQINVLEHIVSCRTSALGGHVLECNSCGYQEVSYNSCRDRHCPKCQYEAKSKWVSARLKELLPIPYYHVVFTLPHSLNDLILYNKRALYDALFSSASETLKKFGADERYLGGKIGFIGILHTWGQTLCQHVHLHFIVAGGGWNKEEGWKTLPYKDKFIFPVRAMSKVYRGKFISRLKRLYYSNELQMPESCDSLKAGHIFESFLYSISQKSWRIYSKKPFAGPEEVIRYIGRYTHRVAISNYRLLSIDGGFVRFRYKDYKDNGQIKIMKLSAAEFLRRFLLHVLPEGYKKIRFFGFLSNGCKEEYLSRIRAAMEIESPVETSDGEDEEREKRHVCPDCKEGHLEIIDSFSREPFYAYANSS